MRDAAGAVLYVGKAKTCATASRNISENLPTPGEDPSLVALIRSIDYIAWREREALLTERQHPTYSLSSMKCGRTSKTYPT